MEFCLNYPLLCGFWCLYNFNEIGVGDSIKVCSADFVSSHRGFVHFQDVYKSALLTNFDVPKFLAECVHPHDRSDA